MSQPIDIIKRSGEEDIFIVRKLIRSLLNAGAGREDISMITCETGRELSPGIKTSLIYRNNNIARTGYHTVQRNLLK